MWVLSKFVCVCDLYRIGTWQSSWGENCRTYHGFKCEDFVGRVTDLAGCCHKAQLERSVLQRFYMGFLCCKQVCSANADIAHWLVHISGLMCFLIMLFNWRLGQRMEFQGYEDEMSDWFVLLLRHTEYQWLQMQCVAWTHAWPSCNKHISVGGSSGAGGQVRSEDCLGTKRSPTYARPSEYVLRIHAGCLGVLKKLVFQAHRRVPHDWCRRILKKDYFALKTNGIRWCFSKMITIFTGNLYSMYVVLQGIGSLPCIRVYIIYVIPFGE